MTLTEFLLARIDEDEWACDAASGEIEWIGARLVPLKPRLLAECAVKRQIISDIVAGDAEWQQPDMDGPWVPNAMLRLLASVYADHPDYDEAAWGLRPRFTPAQRQELADMAARLRAERPNLPDGI